jgi:hypothetical protein
MSKISDGLQCIMLGFVVTLLSSCESKDLCFDHEGHTATTTTHVSISLDRTILGGTTGSTDSDSTAVDQPDPESILVQCYNEEGELVSVYIPSSDGELTIPDGRCTLLFYNNDTEYIVLEDLSRLYQAVATTRTDISTPFDDRDLVIANQPDALYCDLIEVYYSQLESDTLQVDLKPVVFTYNIECTVPAGVQYLAKAQGILTGMAAGVYLSTRTTTDDEVAVLFECETETAITSAVRSFGAPGYSEGAAAKARACSVSLELTLINGEVSYYDFDVSDQMQSQPQGGEIHIALPEEILQPTTSQTTAPFDVDVSDWGDYQEIIVN